MYCPCLRRLEIPTVVDFTTKAPYSSKLFIKTTSGFNPWSPTWQTGAHPIQLTRGSYSELGTYYHHRHQRIVTRLPTRQDGINRDKVYWPQPFHQTVRELWCWIHTESLAWFEKKKTARSLWKQGRQYTVKTIHKLFLSTKFHRVSSVFSLNSFDGLSYHPANYATWKTSVYHRDHKNS